MIRVQRDDLSSAAMVALPDEHLAEIKSMRSARDSRSRGVGRRVLGAVLDSARATGCRRLLLETGSSDFYLPAQRLYLRNGFVFRGPFADYREDPNSVYMELRLR